MLDDRHELQLEERGGDEPSEAAVEEAREASLGSESSLGPATPITSLSETGSATRDSDSGASSVEAAESIRPEAQGEQGQPEQEQAALGESGEVEDQESAATMTMDHLLANMERGFRSFHRNEVVEGIVVGVDKDGGVLVDIGTKSEGILGGSEVSRYVAEGNPPLKVGDRLVASVLQPETSEGHVVLSLSRARSERGWRAAERLLETGQSFEATVVDRNKGGLIVDLQGVRGFVPISQVVGLRQGATTEEEIEARLAEHVGSTVSLKVLEMNRRRNRLILSQRAAVQEQRASRKEQLLNELVEGEIRLGRVSSICDFGAFVDLGGADGLVHLSEMSWDQVGNPADIVKVGEQVSVYVLGVDRDKKKIALSMRRSQPEPWSLVPEKYHPGDIVDATVTKLAAFGAFARIEPGVEGLIHISELSDERIAHPNKVVKEGDRVRVRVLRVEPERRRLALSLRQAGGIVDSAPEAVASEDAKPEFEAEETVSGVVSSELAEQDTMPEVEVQPQEDAANASESAASDAVEESD